MLFGPQRLLPALRKHVHGYLASNSSVCLVHGYPYGYGCSGTTLRSVVAGIYRLATESDLANWCPELAATVILLSWMDARDFGELPPVPTNLAHLAVHDEFPEGADEYCSGPTKVIKIPSAKCCTFLGLR